MPDDTCPFVSRSGMKLAAALDAFDLNVRGKSCIDFGSHVGGFVDCLLQHGAASVTAVEPGYGVLDYNLRRDERVVVCERTNAIHYTCDTPADVITIDVGWTPQRLILPAARRCLDADGQVMSLIKPHYEAPKDWLVRGVLRPEKMEDVLDQCRRDVESLGWRIVGTMQSPIAGHGGNIEQLWHLTTV